MSAGAIARLWASVSVPRFREHRLRTGLTLLGIALGVAVLVAVVLLNRSILASFNATVDDIGGKADLMVTGGAGGFDEALFEPVRATPGVRSATPMVQQTTLVRAPGAEGERVLLLGVDFLGTDDEQFRTYDSREMSAIKEDPIAFLNSRTNIIVSRQLAKRFGLTLHSKLPLATPRGVEAFDVWGFIEDEGVGRAFGGAVAVMYYQAMQVAFARGNNIDRIDVAVAPGADQAELSRRLAAKTPGLTVERPERKNERTLKMLTALRTGLTMASLIAVLVGMFLIYNTMSISVVQRRRELGILRALGTTRREVQALIAFEGAVLGAIGALLGVALGIGLARGLLTGMSRTVSELYFAVAAGELALEPMVVALGVGLGVVAAVLSSLAPAREATRVQPVETLRTGTVVSERARSRVGLTDLVALAFFALTVPLVRAPSVQGMPLGAYIAGLCIVIGAALLAPRVVLVMHALLRPMMARLPGALGQLANDNLGRDRERAGVTAGALIVGVAMGTSFAAFIGSFVTSTMEWVDQSVPADLFVTSAARFAGAKNVPMQDLLSDELRALPGVQAVERLRIADLDYEDMSIKLLSSDTAVYLGRSCFKFLEGSNDVVPEIIGGGVLVSESLSRRRNVHAGDTITLPTRTGPAEFDVRGVIVDRTSEQGAVFMDRAVYVARFGDDRVDTYKLYVTPGTDLESVRRPIVARWGEKYDLFVLTNREFKAEIIALVGQVFDIMHLLELVAIIIAVLGVVNAMLASVLDRVREIGVLRAMGMLQRQARRLVMIEARLLGACSAATGVGAGVWLGHVLVTYVAVVQSGWYVGLRLPWGSIAQLAVLVVTASVLAGWYPARVAARLRVTEALGYE